MSAIVQENLALLGLRVEDLVSGFKGVVVTMTFDLYGCVQALVHPGVNADGKMGEREWFDVARLVVVDNRPVMPVPTFAGAAKDPLKGPESKPAYPRG